MNRFTYYPLHPMAYLIGKEQMGERLDRHFHHIEEGASPRARPIAKLSVLDQLKSIIHLVARELTQALAVPAFVRLACVGSPAS